MEAVREDRLQEVKGAKWRGVTVRTRQWGQMQVETKGRRESGVVTHTCNQSQHFGGWGRRIMSSRIALGYYIQRSYLKTQNKQKNHPNPNQQK
jgi:hypothetical protein